MGLLAIDLKPPVPANHLRRSHSQILQRPAQSAHFPLKNHHDQESEIWFRSSNDLLKTSHRHAVLADQPFQSKRPALCRDLLPHHHKMEPFASPSPSIKAQSEKHTSNESSSSNCHAITVLRHCIKKIRLSEEPFILIGL